MPLSTFESGHNIEWSSNSGKWYIKMDKNTMNRRSRHRGPPRNEINVAVLEHIPKPNLNVLKVKNQKDEAMRIFNETPTPIYDEFMREKNAIAKNYKGRNNLEAIEKLFYIYADKLKSKYPGCKITFPTSSSGQHQAFSASQGQNYFLQLQKSEKACQLDLSDTYGQPLWIDIQRGLDEAERKRVNAYKEELLKEGKYIYKTKEAEKKRFASVKQGNLLGLSNKPEVNLLQFGPTKEGLNAREKELKNLFGGKTRKNRKTRKN